MAVSSLFFSRGTARAVVAAAMLLLCALMLGHARLADADAAAEGAADTTQAASSQTITQRFAIHAQATFVQQGSDGFAAPYSGPDSLTPDTTRETADISVYLGARLWQGAQAWVEPEIDQGFGLDDTLGVAGFPSGEDYKVGSRLPYFRLPRWFVRQTLATGTQREAVPGVADQLAGSQSPERWVFTLGKFAVTDVFDTNQYAHDPRMDFFNWAAVDAGTFDYAADAWGYSAGAAAERYTGGWALRGGFFDLSNVPNSESLEPGFDEFQVDAEIERRYQLFGQTARAVLTGFDSRGRMGLLDEASELALSTGTPADTAKVRQYRGRMGVSLDLEQPITPDLGVFARAGKATGNVESYEFTDIDRTVEVGAALQGRRWHRAEDTVGFAAIDNGISAQREEYLNLGGRGILCGDGKLPHPAAEQILETYYSFAARSWAQVSLDYQWIDNPCYNTDRGPISVAAVRVHAQF